LREFGSASDGDGVGILAGCLKRNAFVPGGPQVVPDLTASLIKLRIILLAALYRDLTLGSSAKQFGRASSAPHDPQGLAGNVPPFRTTIWDNDRFMKIEDSIRDIRSFAVTQPAIWRVTDGFLSAVVGTAQKYSTGRLFRLKVTAAAILLSLLVAFPPYKSMPAQLHKTANLPIRAIQWKIQHPLAPIPENLKDPNISISATHVNKLELRFTIPLLGRLSGTGAWTVVVWSHLTGIGVFYLLAGLALEALGDPVGSALYVIGLGATYFGTCFFNDYMFGDGIAFFFMLFSVACRQPLLSAISFVVAAFCDERAVMAAPLLLFFVMVRFRDAGQLAQRRRSSIAIISGVALWAILRWWLAAAFKLSTGTTSLASFSVIQDSLGWNFPIVFADVFKASWVLFALALLSLASQRNRTSFATLLFTFGIAIAPAFVVVDFRRSVAYAFIVFLISLHFLRGDSEASRKWLAAILVLNILYTPLCESIVRITGCTKCPFWAHWPP
jgi:hypothetical protein